MATVEYSKATITDDKGRVLKEGEKEKQKYGRLNWWAESDLNKKGDMIEATLKFLAHHNSAYLEQLTVSTRLYGNTSAFSLMGSAFTRASSVAPSPSAQRISFNLISAVVDTLTSQQAKAKIVPTFITSGGRWGLQRKAENLSKFLGGVFYENNVHKKQNMAFRDGAVWGDGIVHPHRTPDDRVGIDRCLPHEFLEDDVEAMVSGRSMQKHRIKIADRSSVEEYFQDDKEAQQKIRDAGPANMQEVSGQGSPGDLVCVSESYRLPSAPGKNDGQKVFCIGSQVLTVEPWEKNYFPYPTFQYSRRILGCRGQGVSERLQNLQGEINRLMILIQKSMWMGGSFKVLIPIGSKIVTQHINNEVGAIIHYAGDTPPQYVTPPMIQQDIYSYVDSLIMKGFRQEGVSEMKNAGEVPVGVKSGRAMREWDQIADDRQLELGQSIEDFNLEIGMQSIDVVKDIFKDKKSYKVTWPGVRFIETIDWKDVCLEREEYQLKAFPTSSLPEDPDEKLETITEYMQAGLLSPRAGRRLLRTEDLEMSDMLASAAEDLICKTIESILYDKEFDESMRPDGNWDLQLAKQLCLEYYNFAKVNNCPEENLQLLRDFQSYVDEEMGLTQSAAASPGVGAGAPTPSGPNAAGAPPMANPQPTPMSQMVPNSATAVGQ